VADVLQPCRPEQGVGDGVGEYVGVGVAEESLVERDLNASEDELAPRVRPGEGVGVYA
jgi:hypothetical protein